MLVPKDYPVSLGYAWVCDAGEAAKSYIQKHLGTNMVQVSTPTDIARESERVARALYGDISSFRVNALYAIPEKGPRVGWDIQVNFMLNGLKYTVDLEIQEKDGQVTNARLIDTMVPL